MNKPILILSRFFCFSLQTDRKTFETLSQVRDTSAEQAQQRPAEYLLGMEANLTVFGRGRQSVAGMSGYYLTYGQTAKHPKTGATVEFRTIDFYFAGYGHVGMVRGVSTARTFFDYRPLFTEIARRLEYRR